MGINSIKIILLQFSIRLTLLLLLILLSCNTTGPSDIDPKQWTKISSLEGVDVMDVKVYNECIYIAGRDVNDRGVIFKSSDAIHWETFSNSIGDSLDRGVGAIDFWNGDLIACFSGKPIYLVKGENVVPISNPILDVVKEMIVDNNDKILIGTMNNYYLKYYYRDSLYNISDSLYTDPYSSNCYNQTGITGLNITCFLKDKYSQNVLIGNYAFNHHFVTAFYDGKIECFETEGLSVNDKFNGCHDIIFAGSKLLAAGYASIKWLENNKWKTYGDSLPKTSNGKPTIATGISFDEADNSLYAAANYIGVLKWEEKSGWQSFNSGLETFQGFYDFISDIVYFKGVLLITYGTNNAYQSNLRGARYYKIR